MIVEVGKREKILIDSLTKFNEIILFLQYLAIVVCVRTPSVFYFIY